MTHDDPHQRSSRVDLVVFGEFLTPLTMAFRRDAVARAE
jgi:hypothetical protein